MANHRAIEVIARALLLEGSMVLLCQNRRHGYYFLPGGHVEFGEPAASALARELLEECGLEIQVRACVLVTEGSFQSQGRPHHEINLVFHVERREVGEIASRESSIGFEWVALAAIPDLDIRPVALRAWLAAGAGSQAESPTAVWVSEITGITGG